ncbi:hypothetical protein LMG7974_01631 [Campylobacter majalis]|uniref:Replication initiation protein n=1 Tax=Campylobacter majalis TaxID=2790656 RepID=A0ABM8Q9R6_9BACT|nr:hypothetical protein [Campylobacter majalis]CAD7289554.1 hypothetical protein LMG7974_01631 [Campylobacter majalis]
MKQLKTDKKIEYSTGIDAMRFIMPKATFLKFIKKIELSSKLRAVSRNKKVKGYISDKFKNYKPLIMPKGHEYKVRYMSFKRGVDSLTNTMLVVENSNELNDLCRKRKKPFGYFVKVEFVGLYQPSREVYKKTYEILAKFLKRFKCDSFDLATDIDSDRQSGAKNKEWFSRLLRPFGGDVRSYSTSLYLNKCRKERFYNLSKVCFYDKFKKMSVCHRQKIDSKYQKWHRIELTFKLKAKFRKAWEHEGINEYIQIMDEISNRLSDGMYPFGVDLKILKNQVAFFKDNRRALSFTKSA